MTKENAHIIADCIYELVRHGLIAQAIVGNIDKETATKRAIKMATRILKQYQ